MVLSKNDPLFENFQNSIPKGCIATPIDVLCSNIVKFVRREIGKIVRCLPDKKQHFTWLSSCRYCVDRGQNLPGPAASPRQCTQSDPGFVQIGSLSAELFPNA